MAHHPRDEKKGNARQIAGYGIDDSWWWRGTSSGRRGEIQEGSLEEVTRGQQELGRAF